MPPEVKAERYREAGVDLGAAERAMKLIRPLVRGTHDSRVVAGHGAFAGLWRQPGEGAPLLAATIDGLGTKVKVAQAVGRHREAGRDLVNHCVDDLLASGARPAFFLDYFACGRLEPEVLAQLVGGMAQACGEAGCALLGGETAEMPDCYPPGEYDLAGCMIGLAPEGELPGPSRVKVGDLILGLPSEGLHTNGFSLARRVLLTEAKYSLEDHVPELGRVLADELMRPHLSYLPFVWPSLERGEISALAHVTGGGIPGNLSRVIPPTCGARLRPGSWPEPAIFALLRERGELAEAEMREVFNMGLGMILIVPEGEGTGIVDRLATQGIKCFRVGEIVPGDGTVSFLAGES